MSSIRYVFSAPVKEGALQEFRTWLNKNEDRIRDHSPDGWDLEGLYFGVFGLSDNLFEVHWNLKSYGALDEAVGAAEATANASDGWSRVQHEWFSFLQTTGVSGRVLKPAGHERLCVLAS